MERPHITYFAQCRAFGTRNTAQMQRFCFVNRTGFRLSHIRRIVCYTQCTALERNAQYITVEYTTRNITPAFQFESQ